MYTNNALISVVRLTNYFVFQIFLHMNMQNMHWYAAVVNVHKREIQILDSMLSHTHRPELQRTVNSIA